MGVRAQRHLISADAQANAAKCLKISALREMAELEISAAARNYYLLSAQEMEETIEVHQ